MAVGYREGSKMISLGSFLGAFVFSGTLVISNVVFSSSKGNIKMPKWNTLKELAFYCLFVLIVCIFGLLGRTGYPFIICFAAVYVFYIISTIYAEKLDKKR